ncbi:RNA-binding S4 domain-containing protein [Rhizobium rhizosphaerae]|nr:RNA-binding S4 domain-containing protein [Xaviernesmea rhizosphaerae]
MAEEQRLTGMAGERQRLDKWLFFTRLQKSRSIAQKAIEQGLVRVNAVRVSQSSAQVKPGDVVTLSLDRQDRIVKVLASGTRRGPYEEARLLYEDLTPPQDPENRPTLYEIATRERGAGRPTKKERREIDALTPYPDED